MYIIYIADTETTGLDKDQNDIIELSMCRLKISDLDNFDQDTWYLKALNPQAITDKAMSVNGYKKEDVLGLTKEGSEKFIEPAKILPLVENWVAEDDVSANERMFIAQNVNFDFDFMTNLWTKQNAIDTFPFSKKNKLDTIDIVRLIDLLTGNVRQSYSLTELVKSFGITKRNHHKAADDVLMTKDLLVKLLKPLVPAAKSILDSIQLEQK